MQIKLKEFINGKLMEIRWEHNTVRFSMYGDLLKARVRVSKSSAIHRAWNKKVY
jgi:hypothetical protein